MENPFPLSFFDFVFFFHHNSVLHFVSLQLFDAHATEHSALLDRFDKASLIEFSALEQGGCQTRLCMGVNFKGEKEKGGIYTKRLR